MGNLIRCRCCGNRVENTIKLDILGDICSKCLDLENEDGYIVRDNLGIEPFVDYINQMGFSNVYNKFLKDFSRLFKNIYFTGIHTCKGKCGYYLTFNCIDTQKKYCVCSISVLDSKTKKAIKLKRRYLHSKESVLYTPNGKIMDVDDLDNYNVKSLFGDEFHNFIVQYPFCDYETEKLIRELRSKE